MSKGMKYKVRRLSNSEAVEFLRRNYGGRVIVGDINYGLYSRDELLACYIFEKGNECSYLRVICNSFGIYYNFYALSFILKRFNKDIGGILRIDKSCYVLRDELYLNDFNAVGDYYERAASVVGYIYRIVSPEGRCYVGLKKSPVFVEDYWSSSQNVEYWSDLKKYGKSLFKRDILEWCYSISELNAREQYYIDKYFAMVDCGGYNLCKVFPHFISSDAGVDRRKKRMIEYWNNPENRKLHGLRIKNSAKYIKSRATVGESISAGILSSPLHVDQYAFTQSENFRKKQSIISSNSRWYNNGITQVFIEGECPEGYVSGMLESTTKGRTKSVEHRAALSAALKSMRWWTDGTNNIRSRECPEGYYLGRTYVGEVGMVWYNDGKSNYKYVKGSQPYGYKLGRIGRFESGYSYDEVVELSSRYSYSELGVMWNCSAACVRSYLKRLGIVKVKVR